MKSLSFIIPVYNGQQYICRCLKSIFIQNYPDIEIILVDDGSTDNSIEAIKKSISLYNKKNYNTIIISQKNQGVSYARNAGIQASTSDYIAFIDQDDYILPDFCTTFMTQVEKNSYDIVIGGFIRKNDNNKVTRIMKATGDEWSKYCLTYPWARIIRREFLTANNIFFKKTSIGEDVYFDLISYSYTNSIKMISNCLYVWSDNPVSVSNQKYTSINKLVNPIHTFDITLNNIKKNGYIPKDYLEYYFIKFVVWYLLTNMRNSSKADMIKTRHELFAWLQANFPEHLKNKNISPFKPKGDMLKNKLAVFMYINFYKLGLDKLLFSIFSK